MKKILGLAALVVALGLVAFSNRPVASHTLKFVGDVRVAADVQNEFNWRELSVTCSGASEAACQIVVPEDNYLLTNSTPFFKYLDVTKVDLSAITTYSDANGAQYKPQQSGGTGTLTSITNQVHIP